MPDHYDTFTKGEVLVEQGQEIGEEALILLKLEHEKMLSLRGQRDTILSPGGDSRPRGLYLLFDARGFGRARGIDVPEREPARFTLLDGHAGTRRGSLERDLARYGLHPPCLHVLDAEPHS